MCTQYEYLFYQCDDERQTLCYNIIQNNDTLNNKFDCN